ncbi:MAG: hypothetical protein AAF353_15585 [Pseudomonadota bacterium]
MISTLMLDSVQANTSPPVEFAELGFYEDTPAAAAISPKDRPLSDSFSESRARYIYSLLKLKNNLWQLESQNINVTLRYYRSNGTLLAQPTVEQTIPAEWEYIDLWAGWGAEEAGEWQADNYRVEAWINNNEKIGEASFRIKSNKVSTSRSEKVEFDRMGFYEAGPDDSAPEDWNDSRVKNHFKKSSTRYVFTMINLKNLQWQLADQSVKIHIRYYHSDGRLYGDPVIEYDIPSNWEYAELWNGWGWDDPGNWPEDHYRVELWLDNREKIGESFFTIH